MALVSSWEKGIRQGRCWGSPRIRRRLSRDSSAAALLDFASAADLEHWLARNLPN